MLGCPRRAKLECHILAMVGGCRSFHRSAGGRMRFLSIDRVELMPRIGVRQVEGLAPSGEMRESVGLKHFIRMGFRGKDLFNTIRGFADRLFQQFRSGLGITDQVVAWSWSNNK